MLAEIRVAARFRSCAADWGRMCPVRTYHIEGSGSGVLVSTERRTDAKRHAVGEERTAWTSLATGCARVRMTDAICREDLETVRKRW